MGEKKTLFVVHMDGHLRNWEVDQKEKRFLKIQNFKRT